MLKQSWNSKWKITYKEKHVHVLWNNETTGRFQKKEWIGIPTIGNNQPTQEGLLEKFCMENKPHRYLKKAT